MSLTDFIKIPWNKYEAVLLVDAYQRCRTGELTKNQSVAQLSRRLRFHLLNSGVSISDAYRNESGVSLQMSSIEYLFSAGQSGVSHGSALFRDIVNMYKEDRDGFNALLDVANTKYEKVGDEKMAETDLLDYGVQKELPLFTLNDSGQTKYVSRRLKDILAKRFPKGYKLGSYVEVVRLKKFYLDEYGDELEMEDADIEKDVKACGIEQDGRVYLPELLLPSRLEAELISFIEEYFEGGGRYIFYSVLFQKFDERFLDSSMMNAHMLRQYLAYINKGEWYFSEQYFSNVQNVVVNVQQEVIDFVREKGGGVSEDEVVIGLSYLPEKGVRSAFSDRSANLVSCGRNLRFHLDNFVISKEELAAIENIVQKAISRYKFITFSELMKDMAVNVPSVLEDNVVFTEIGIRNALAIKLGKKFYFYNSVISDFRHPIKPEDAFMEMAKRPRYTIDDVKALADACGSLPNMYLEPMLGYSVRVDKYNFVSKEQVHFDVDAIDNVLLRLCEGDYIALSDVTMLSTLPSCEYKWTPFLLECYVAFYSKAFRLVHNKYFGQANTTGGIVKRSSRINDFNTLVAIAVVDADIPIEKTAVLQFLSDKSYIVQRRYEDIDEVISRANRIKHSKNSN